MKKIVFLSLIILTSCSEIAEQIIDNAEQKREDKYGPHVDYLIHNATEYDFDGAYFNIFNESTDIGGLPSDSYSTIYNSYYILNPASAVMYFNGKKFSYIAPSYITRDTIRERGTYVYEIYIDNLSERTLKVDLVKR